MSLHKFAEQVASQGRGDDSLLVHMTPDEVRNLQKFAEANGTTLTINPTTGLPEAGLLSDLFKTIAPIALGAFLGPAGVAFGGPGLSAVMAGAATGGITALATGSLSRGLMAGLGAYGGAGLGESLMNAGTGGLAAADIGAQQLAGSFPTLAEGATQEQIAKYATDVGALRDTAVANAGNAGFMERASAGLGAIANNPAPYAKDLFKYGSAAVAPIAADMMTPTTTKMPELGNTGYIRQKIYDPYTQTYRSMAPVKANEWKDRQFSDIYRGASGGIVALAGGGMAHFDEGDLVKDKPTGLQTLTQAAPTFNQYTNQQIGDYLKANPNADIAAATAATNADPNAVNAYIAGLTGDFKASTDTTGGTGTTDIYKKLQELGIDPNEYFKSVTANDPNYAGWSEADITKAYDLNTDAFALADTLKGNVTDTDWTRLMESGNYSVNDMAQTFGLSTKEVQDRYDAVKKAEAEAAAKAAAEKAAAEAAAKAEADAAAKAAADKAAADAAAKAEADAISKRLADEAAVKAAAEKAAADKAIADAIAADEKAAADRAAAAKAVNDARLKAIADEDAAAKVRGDAARAAYEKAEAEKAAAAKVIADAAAAKIAAEKAAADAAAKALADGKTLAEATAAAAKAKAEADAIAKAAADKAAADAAAAANTVSTIGTVDLDTDTGVSLDETDSTSTGLSTLAGTKSGDIKSSVITDGTYAGTTGTAAAIGTKVGQGVVSGTGSETSTGTTGPIIDFTGASAFSTSPLTLAKTQIAEQSAATAAADKTKLNLYSQWGASNPNATEADHANFIDKIGLKPETAAQVLNMSPQQAKNMYYNAKYNKMTGDSQSAYNFLMGKGAYPTKSGVGEIMRPYGEATLGMPASTNKKMLYDPATRSYKANPDYVGSYRDSTGEVNYTMSPQEIFDYFKSNAGQKDSETYDWALENNISPQEIASALGAPLSEIAAKWRDAKAKKDKAAAEAKAKAGTGTVDTSGGGGDGAGGGTKYVGDCGVCAKLS
jgi:hypothetical protein